MAAPRTQETKMLEPCKWQFFQWYMIDDYPLSTVKRYFDILFLYLLTYRGINRQASHNNWMSRRKEWNKIWNIPDSMRGKILQTPSDLFNFPLWFEGTDFAPEFQPFLNVNGEALNPFHVTLPNHPEPSNTLNTSKHAMDRDQETESLPKTQINRTHSESSLVSLSSVPPFHPASSQLDHSSYIQQAPEASYARRWSSAPTLQVADLVFHPPMLPAAYLALPAFDGYGLNQPIPWSVTPTVEGNHNAQSQPQYFFSATLSTFNAPVAPTVTSFYDSLPYRPVVSRLSSEEHDLDPLAETLILSPSYDSWSRRPSYDETLPQHRPDH